MPKISVIIPVYNTEKYLRQCLDSVVNQTLKDIEIVCIDDGSTDNSLNILEEYAAKDSRILLLKQNNKNANNARTYGISKASGEYIGFVDSDDWIDLNYYETLYKSASQNNADISRITYKYVNKECVTDSELNLVLLKKSSKHQILGKNEHSVVIWNAIYKTSFLREFKIDYFDSELSMCHDIPFTARVTMLSRKTVPCCGSCYYYRKDREGQLITKSLKRLKFSLSANIITTDFLNSISNKITQDEYIEAFGRCISRLRGLLKEYISTPNMREDEVFVHDYLENYNKILKGFKYKNKYKCLKKFDNCIDLIKSKNYKLYKYKIFALKDISVSDLEDYYKVCKNLIISLTSYPERIKTAAKNIESLLNQTIKVQVILWLTEKEFPNRELDLPQELLNLKSRGLEIEWCNNKIKSYTKLIPALEKYPDKYIITADDDILYEKICVESLVKTYLKYPKCIIANRAHYITLKNNQPALYQNWEQNTEFNTPSFRLFLTGVATVLYFPGCFYEDITNENLFLNICEDTDDIWFWAMAVLKGTKIKLAQRNCNRLQLIDGTQKIALFQKNCIDGNNDKNLKLMFKYYPGLLKQLKSEFLLSDLFSVRRDKKNSSYILTILKRRLRIKSKKMMLKNIEKNLLEQDEKFLLQEQKIEKLTQLASENNYANIFRDTINNSQWLKDKNFSLSGAAANYSFAYILFRILDDLNPKNILELGLGQTSKLTTQYVNNKNNDATLDIIEHDEKWIEEFSKKLLVRENTHICHKNIINFNLYGIVSDKYEDLSDITPDKKYDLIIIDGPIGYKKIYPRTNILDLIPQNLSEDFVIILDDAERQGEQNTAKLIFKKLDENNIKYEFSYKQGLKKQLIITSSSYKFVHWI